MLECLVSLPSELIICGDFNFHVDSPNDTNSQNFLRILDSFGLRQHITFPTHNQGHTLDLLITQFDSYAINSVGFDFPFLSDHYAIHASILIQNKVRPLTTSKTIREIKKINISQFKQDLLNSDLVKFPSTTLAELSKQFTCTLNNLLDKHAPLKIFVALKGLINHSSHLKLGLQKQHEVGLRLNIDVLERNQIF